VIVWVAHKIDVGTAGVHCPKGTGIFFDMGGVDILANLHVPAHPRKLTAWVIGAGMVALRLNPVNPQVLFQKFIW
jgi:hypothetical protein